MTPLSPDLAADVTYLTLMERSRWDVTGKLTDCLPPGNSSMSDQPQQHSQLPHLAQPPTGPPSVPQLIPHSPIGESNVHGHHQAIVTLLAPKFNR